MLNVERKIPTSLDQNDQRKRCHETLLVSFDSEKLHVVVVGVPWEHSLIEDEFLQEVDSKALFDVFPMMRILIK
jgi:hypothetical protein